MIRSFLLLSMLAVATGCGKPPAVGTGGDPPEPGVRPSDDPALALEHDPDMTGKTRRYDWTDYQPDGTVFKKVRFIEAYTTDGKRRHRDEKQKGENVEDYRRRVKGGDVQHAVAFSSGPRSTGLAWLPRIKAGVKPGGTWEFVPAGGAKVYWPYNVTGGGVVRAGGEPSDKIRWTYKEVGSDRGRSCAVVLEEYLDGDTVQESWTRWHVRGEGVVRQEYRRRTKGGSLVLDRVFVFDPAEAAPVARGDEPPARTLPPRLPAASELTRLKRHEFVIYYKGFTEDQMSAYLDHLHKHYGQGSVQFRTGGVFSHMPKLAAADKGMHVVREDDFTRILLPVDGPRAKATSPYFGNVAVPLCHSLIRIDESVRGKVAYATCDEDCKTIYQRSPGFDR